MEKGLESSGELYKVNQQIMVNLTFVREDNSQEYHVYSLNYAFILLKHFI